MTPRIRLAVTATFGLALAFTGLLAGAETSPLVLKAFSHHSDGADRVFDIDVQNVSAQDALVRGRLVAISVYDATPADVMGIQNAAIKAGETKSFEIRWQGAPFVGRVRTLFVVSDGRNPSLVTSADFWILPVKETVIFLAALIILVALVLLLMRLPYYLRERIPENMAAYSVEPGDTVVSVSVRYGVTWQEIVKVNKLKPPYDIKPGRRVFIPKHALQKPKEETPTQPKS